MGELPILKIECLVYNHEAFLRDCLEGVVMQKTNFKFEAIVHDDASTDRSADIIREYAEKYPDIIKPIYQTENLYSRGDGSLRRVIREALQGAKYIAVCEGDDYWTDPYKLQKQVDFLESNPDYMMCIHNAKVINEDSLKTGFCKGLIKDEDYTSFDFINAWIWPTASFVFRSEVLSYKYKGPERILNADIILLLVANELGKVRGFSDEMSAYRVHGGGVSSSSNGYLRHLKFKIKQYEFILDNFKKINRTQVKQKIGLVSIERARVLDKKFSKAWFKELFYGLWLNPKILLEKILGHEIKESF